MGWACCELLPIVMNPLQDQRWLHQEKNTDRQISKKMKNKSRLISENSKDYWEEMLRLLAAGTLAVKKYSGFIGFKGNRTVT